MLRNQITKTLLVGVIAVLLAGTAGLQAQGTLFVKNNNVGILQANPTHPLHITAATGAALEVATFENNSGAFFVLRDFSIPVSWSVATTGGILVLDQQQNAGFEFYVDGAGNTVIGGALFQNSSRTLKHQIEPVAARDYLDLVAKMPVAEWTYIEDETGARHVGPMAEDFYEAFGLGLGNRNMAPSDNAGVALAAIKGLHEVVQEKDGTIDELSQRVAELEKLVAQLVDR